MSAAQKIWILEQYRSPLRLVKEDKASKTERWIFEGPCADFNGKNDNERYYDKDDYLSHFSYLQPQIENNSLAGELDHSEDYNPKMKDLSHIVRKLWYREDLNQVWIRIELFEEGDGKKAIEYAKKGMPIYISSRASGYIDDDGNVTLDTIYTFDIVYRPGFKVAELKRSGGKNNTSEGKVIRLYESSQKKYSSSNSSIMLLEWKEPTESTKINNKKETSSIMEQDINKPATIGDLNKIYEAINNEITLLKKAMNPNSDLRIKAGSQMIREDKNSSSIKVLEEKLAEQYATVAAVNELAKKLDAIMVWSELVRKAVNEQDEVNKKYHKHINMLVNKVNEASDNEPTGKFSQSIMELKKDVVALKKYADINTSFVNKMADKQDLIYEHSNLATKFVNDLDTQLKENLNLINKLESNVKTIHEHANLSTEFVNNINKKVKKMSTKIYEEVDQEKIDNALKDFDGQYEIIGNDITFSNPDIADSVAVALDSAGIKTEKSEGKLTINENKQANKPVVPAGKQKVDINESKIPVGKGKIDITNISNTTDKTILSVKKKIAEKMIVGVVDKYPYVSVLENDEIVNFSKLNDVKKKIISDKVYESGTENRVGVLNIIRSVNSDRGVVRMLSNMPDRIKPVWNKLEKNERQQIVSLYNLKTLNSDMEVRAFWESLNLGNTNLQRMNENRAGIDKVELEMGSDDISLGYGDDDVKSILGV